MTAAVERAHAYHLVHRSIVECRRCALMTSEDACARAPVPFRGPIPNRVMVLGDAPGAADDADGKPFSGPVGELMTRVCSETGLNFIRWFRTNIVCCYGDGAPSDGAITSCLTNLRAQVRLCDPEWVLSIGGAPLRVALAPTGITKLHGRPFECAQGPLNGRKVFPVHHAASALRSKRVADTLRFDLETFAAVLRGDLDWRVVGGANKWR
jgi:DNA polymerase